ncbi:RDD family protein [Prauserella sp. ASG 168]|uniref:RDD family protein n=2 Tax=Prauserella cavernicola TaxID=2800127 RepID=A0A934V8N4_9PSEU|nr:RDD family protein [Prauserella cavernicola]
MIARRGSQHVVDWALAVGSGCLAGVLTGFVALPLVRWGLVPSTVALWVTAIVLVGGAFVADVLIQVWVPLRRGGITPGMLVLGLRVETLRGGHPRARDFFLRWLLFTVDGLLLGLVAVVGIAVTDRRQRLGDVVARTVVVRTS